MGRLRGDEVTGRQRLRWSERAGGVLVSVCGDTVSVGEE